VVEVPGAGLPRVSGLAPAQPNPMTRSTTMAYAIAPADAGPVSLTIYDVAGRVVRTLVNEAREAGTYTAVWDRRTDDGDFTAGGVYFTELRINGRKLQRKLTVVQ
jgi:flagellar hook assembly protein FlgD